MSPTEQTELPTGLVATRGYLGRFAFLYVALGVVLIAAIAGIVALALQKGPPTPPIWSSWRPTTANTTKATQEIADHLAGRYRLSATGAQLVAVLPSAPEITRHTKVSSISTIAIRTTPTATTFSRIFKANTAVQVQLCGLGDLCSIQGGTATAQRERLVRREALEIALYTFRYVPQVATVLAYLPPPPGQQPSTLLLLERSDFRDQLAEPLSKTLPLTTPPLPTSADKAEAARIDKLTLPLEYSYEYEVLPDGTAALILASST